jgi:hypothetical protein
MKRNMTPYEIDIVLLMKNDLIFLLFMCDGLLG